MKLINQPTHNLLDYLLVIVFLMAPTTLGLDGFAATLAFSLGVAHLVVTLGTRFPYSFINWLTPRTHGAIEFIAGLTLVILPYIDVLQGGIERQFFAVMGLAILVIWFVTGYVRNPMNQDSQNMF